MKRHLLSAVAMGLALLLPAPAFACTPVPARSWKGSVQLSTPAQSVTATAFTNNGCDFPDESLNGVDAVVFDVASHRGLAGAVTWNSSAAVKPNNLVGSFRTASCAHIGSTTLMQATSGKALPFVFPNDAKWLIVQMVSSVPSHDIDVTVTSPGRKCP